MLVVQYNAPTNAYEARCQRCGKLAFSLAAELAALVRLKPPILVPHKCFGEEE
jgi:hypothetical protein